MKYDFSVVPDRSKSSSSKWCAAPNADVLHVPLSTADMEFPTAPKIVEAIKELADSTILGYTNPTPQYYEAVCGWMKRRHDFEVKPEWILPTPGVVYALGMLIDALSEPGEGVIVISPVYYPFDLAVTARERNILYSDLKLEDGRYTIDYADLEEKAAREDARLLLFCNPHNPVGRVWSRDELEKVVEICARHDVFIIDDEIHQDLIMPGYHHTVMATVSDTARESCAVCTSPSKTFNLAGLQCSSIIIPNKTAYAKAKAAHTLNLVTHLNIFAYRACETAYNQCEDWLEEAIQVVHGNALYIEDFMREHFPEIKVFPLEGTYLLWLDMRGLGMTHKELEVLMKQDAGLYLDEGYIFGPGGRGFERINIACSRVTLERAMQRFQDAVSRKRAQWEAEGRPFHQTLAPGDALSGFTYDTVYESGLKLEEHIQKPTILVFSRYYTCSICQMLLSQLRQAWPLIQQKGYDLKVVLQSTQQSVAAATEADPFPFDLICDPNAALYDRYNVFEAGSAFAMAAGEVQLVKAMGGVKKVLMSMSGGEQPEGRAQQLPAVFVITPDGVVRYAHYARSLTDLPDITTLLA